MNCSTRYWTIARLLATGAGGYEHWPSPIARLHCQKNYGDESGTQESDTQESHSAERQPASPSDFERQTDLLKKFRESSSIISLVERAQAGLCLRCFVSEPIVRTCSARALQFGGSNVKNVFQELISELLNDDGETLILFDDENDKIHHKVTPQPGLEPSVQPVDYRFFTLEVLRKWQPGQQTHQSLENWAQYVTKHHNRLTKILVKSGYKRLSDWAQLNRARPIQIQALSIRASQLIQAFHTVYRADWLHSKQHNPDHPKKCPVPSSQQLARMLTLLSSAGIEIHSGTALLEELCQIAGQIREDELAREAGKPSAEPLVTADPQTGEQRDRPDLPTTNDNEPEAIDIRDLLSFLQAQLTDALSQGVEQGVCDRLTILKEGRRKQHTNKYLPGMYKIYFEGLSQRQLQEQLGFTNGAQVSRVLSPKDLIDQVRDRTQEKLTASILNEAHRMGLTDLPPNPSYKQYLTEQLELFINAEIFTEAYAELIGRDRTFNSRYAHALRHYLAIQLPHRPNTHKN